MIQACYFIPLEVLVKNGEPQTGAIEFLEALEQEGMRYVILSEQSSRFRDQISYYLIDRGFHYVRSGYIYTSTMATIDYLQNVFPEKRRIAAFGGQGMLTSLQQSGYEITFDHPDFAMVGMTKNASYDDYSDILDAVLYCRKLVSVDNRRIHRGEGSIGIGNGSVIKMLEYASRTKALSFGKGSKAYLTMACRYMSTAPEDVLYVGNDFQNDIVPAAEYGMNTVLISEGRDLTNIGITEEVHPDFIVNDLSGLAK